jgi:putative transposase
MPQSLAKLYVHLVFSTKGRFPFLKDDALRVELHAYLATVLLNLDCPAVLINSVDDHVHILFKLHRTVTVAKAVEDVKKSSSKWLKSKSPRMGNFAWQAGYGAFSVSESNVPSVVHYIRGQQEHHRIKSFQEEYREFLEKHGIEYDEKYVWD